MKDFSIICAVSLDGIIGDSETNTIPWYLPSDLKHFKALTLEKTVVMGSRTFRSIGRPLPNRDNIVISRTPFIQEGVKAIYRSFEDVHRYEHDGFVVIGGEHIYGEALKHSPSTMFITVVNSLPDGDVRFPIAGRRFLQDSVLTSTNIKYTCSDRSEWLNENGIEFQYTEFKRAQ